MIDIKLFKELYKEIDEKVQKVRVLPMIRNQERDYDGWEYEEYKGKEFITVMSSYYGEDTSSFEIPLSEINNSVEWFEKKYQDELDEEKRKADELREIEKQRVKQNRITSKEQKRKTDMATYRRIKKQLENEK